MAVSVVALVSVFGLGGVVAVTATADDASARPTGGSVLAMLTSRSKAQQEWDPRVGELVEFVELERGLSFKRPVPIDFVTKEEIGRRMGSYYDEPTAATLDQADRHVSRLRALGLISGDIDVLADNRTLYAEGTHAFYDPVEEQIVAPDVELDPLQRSVLVHELTHALQDQHFDLESMQAAAGEDRWSTYEALVEGDAMVIQRRYEDQLDLDDQRLLNERATQGYESFDEAAVTVAPIFRAQQYAPYLLGEPMVETLLEIGGQERLDEAFRGELPSEELVFDPIGFATNPTEPKLPSPLATGHEVPGSSGVIGPLAWYLMLVQATDNATALRAAYGWGNDAYVDIERGDQRCVRIVYAADSGRDLAEMRKALKIWIAVDPASRQLTGDDGTLEITACDPGPDTAIALPVNAQDALYVPVGIADSALTERLGGVDYDQARCLSIEFLGAYSVQELANYPAPSAQTAQDAQVAKQRRAAALQRCR